MIWDLFRKGPSRQQKLEQGLQSALNEAQKGNAGAMESFLDLAREDAKKLKVDIEPRAQAIATTGYGGAMENALRDALDYGRSGHSALMERFLGLAMGYALRAGANIDDRVRGIRSRAKG